MPGGSVGSDPVRVREGSHLILLCAGHLGLNLLDSGAPAGPLLSVGELYLCPLQGVHYSSAQAGDVGSALLQDPHDCDRTACGPLLP